MPPKVLSIAQGRALWDKATADPKVKPKDAELRAMYLRLQAVAKYIQANGHNGRIVVHMPPNFQNGNYYHWRDEKELKQSYAGQLSDLKALQLMPPPPETPPVFALLKVYFYPIREHDDDNMRARTKNAIDFLVTHGYLSGDSPQHIKREYFQQPVKRELARIEFEITITEIPE